MAYFRKLQIQLDDIANCDTDLLVFESLIKDWHGGWDPPPRLFFLQLPGEGEVAVGAEGEGGFAVFVNASEIR